MQLRLLTWNINGLDEKRIGPRMEKLCLNVLVGGDLRAALEGRETRPVPDIVVFQEMTRRAYTSQIRNHFRAAGFQLVPFEVPRDVEDYLLIGVRPPFEIDKTNLDPFLFSPLGRSCLKADITCEGRRFRVMTAHMESLASGSEARVEQLDQLGGWIERATVPCVFAGDTNLRQREWKARDPDLEIIDAYDAADRPREYGPTWWTDDGSRAFRFDRVFFDAASSWQVESFTTRVLPVSSDHAGVEVVLRLP